MGTTRDTALFALARCKHCRLDGRIVHGWGPHDAPVRLVGEAPGADEVRKGRPFVGDSGKLLRRTARKVGLDLAGVRITNTVLCRPPGNHTPTRLEIECCLPRLLADLEGAQLVVALGNTPMRALADDYNLKITSERGRPRCYRDLTVLPTFHPAGVLRAPGNYKYLRSDLDEVVRLLNGGVVRRPPPAEWCVVRAEQLPGIVNFLMTKTICPADLETTGFDPTTDEILELGIEYLPGTIAVFPAALLREKSSRRDLLRLFRTPDLRWLWHHGKFDVAFLRKLGFPARVDEDGLLLSYALREDQGGHDLKTLSGELLGAPPYDLSKKEKDNIRDVPDDRRRSYLAKDVAYLRGVYEQLAPQVRADPHLRRLYTETLIPATEFLSHLEWDGIAVDIDRLDQLDQDLTREVNETSESLERIAGTGFNPRSPKQVSTVLYDRFRLPVPAQHQKSTNADVLEAMQDDLEYRGRKGKIEYRFIELMRKSRKINKSKGTYIDGIRKRLHSDGRLRTSVKQHGTRTGRLSSEDPNLFNIPREQRLRDLFCAPDGCVLIEVDYSQAELRLLTDLSGDPELERVYVSGGDLHDEVVRDVIAGVMPHDTYDEQRFWAKTVNFGIVYGRTPFSISRDFGLSIERATAIVHGWNRKFRVARTFLRGQEEKARRGEPIITRFGRKRRWGLITADTWNHVANEAKNTQIQSEAADLTLRSGILIQRQLPPGAKIVNLVYDSLLFEVPNEHVNEVTELAVSTMQDFARIYLKATIPFVAEAKKGRNWGSLN